MFDSTHIHIAVASDENYARFAGILFHSIIETNKQYFSKITFHLLSNRISEQNLSLIKQVVSKECVELVIHEISNLSERLGIDVPPTISLTAYARLFMEKILSEDIDTVLYLDTDIIVTSPLDSLWEMNLNDNLVGGVLDVFEGDDSKTAVGLYPTAPYINSGVLLINLDAWRRTGLSGQFVSFLKSHNGNVHHHDQGIINGVCAGKIMLLPPQYNVHSTVFSHLYSLIKKITTPYYTKEEYDNAIENPIIIHYTEGFYNRPWKKNCRHPKRMAFFNATVGTPWENMSIEADNRTITVKLLSFIFLHFPYSVYKTTTKMLSWIKKLIS